MDRIMLACFVSASDAITAKQGACGTVAWPVEGVLALLNAEELDWLASHIRSANKSGEGCPIAANGSVTTLSPALPLSDETVACAIRSFIERERVAKERAAETREAKIQEKLAKPDEDYQTESSFNSFTDAAGVKHPQPEHSWYSEPCDSDPRLAEKKARVMATYNERKAAYDADYAANETARKAKKEQQQAESERRAILIREWAGACEDLPDRVRRAANEGLDVRSEVRDYISESVETMLLSIVAPLGGDIAQENYGKEPCNRVPSDRAYRILDRLHERLADISAAAILPVTVNVVAFFRIDVSHKEAKWRNAIDVTITSELYPGHDFGAWVVTEPIDQDEDDE